MTSSFSSKLAAVLLSVFATLAPSGPIYAAECTSPGQVDSIRPELAARYNYVEDGEFSKALNIPTYEWLPAKQPVHSVILAVHGLTLHGRLYRVLARSLAASGVAVVSFDMRGFGRCKYDVNNQFSKNGEDRSEVNHHKSYEDIEKLAGLLKAKYPNARLVAMGESLGCTFCVRLAAEHPDLIQGIALSAPAVRLNKDMYARKEVTQGVESLFKPSHMVNLSGFFAELCSNRPEVQLELVKDPLVLKELKFGALFAADAFVEQTEKWAKLTRNDLPVLILQGSVDGCVSPKHVTDLMNAMSSDDQTLAWRGNYGHLQLETSHMRVATLDAIANWLIAHTPEEQAKLKRFERSISDAGGVVTK